MKILLYGSTFLTSLVEKALTNHQVVGHVPSKKPTFAGKMSSPVIHDVTDCEYDIILSIQYDDKILNLENAYNLHTGILPYYGGCDILYHTLENRETKQGLTFHHMTENYDKGSILSIATYPVLPGDTALDLYKRMCAMAPNFVKACLDLIIISTRGMYPINPTMYKRGDVLNFSKYQQDFQSISDYVYAHS